jgi:hypothetical protein
MIIYGSYMSRSVLHSIDFIHDCGFHHGSEGLRALTIEQIA